MTRNTANVSFYCRESKKNKAGIASGFDCESRPVGRACVCDYPYLVHRNGRVDAQLLYAGKSAPILEVIAGEGSSTLDRYSGRTVGLAFETGISCLAGKIKGDLSAGEGNATCNRIICSSRVVICE